MATAAFAQQAHEETVRALEAQWLKAYEHNDTVAMHTLVAEDFVITFPNGATQTKADLMKLVRTHAGKSGGIHLHTEQTKATVYPATVVLRGVVVSEFEMQGKMQQVKQYYTDTWVYTAQGWQVVASHLTDVPKEDTTPKAGPGVVKKNM